ncbi:MAG: cupin domain-containing protein [Alphaproteobacteria bacterium]|nr:cupin domain-containing protein [Alphaproteobacteria bacterium]
MIDKTAFEATLRREGYDDILTRAWEPNQVVPEHTHPFDAHVLVLDGEVTLTLRGTTHTCRVGDVFKVPAGTPHAETYGPKGARFLAGRRKPPIAA